MAFTGRMYYTDDGGEGAFYYDSATGETHALTVYDPALPFSPNPGCMVPTPDNRILIRCSNLGGQPSEVGIEVDADFGDVASAQVWYADNTIRETVVDPRQTGGAVVNGLTYLTWYGGKSSFGDGQTSWSAFDTSGTEVAKVAAWAFGNAEPNGWACGYVYRDGYLYRGMSANTGHFDRYHVASGAWEQARFPEARLFLGITDTGTIVLLDDFPDAAPYRGGQVSLYDPNDITWTAVVGGPFTETTATPLATWNMIPPGRTTGDTLLEGYGGSNVYVVVGNSLFYGVNGINGVDWGLTDDRWAWGETLQFWELDLTTGTKTKAFGSPHRFYYADGSWTTDSWDSNYYFRSPEFAFGLLPVLSSAGWHLWTTQPMEVR